MTGGPPRGVVALEERERTAVDDGWHRSLWKVHGSTTVQVMRSVLSAALMIIVSMMAGSAAAAAAPSPPHVTVIADSVLTAVIWNQEPLAILQRGFETDLEVGVCRRLTGTSCPYEGARVPTLVDVVHALGPRIGPTVLVEVGYDDYPETFAQSVEEAITALLDAGAKRILWANMREWQPQYLPMNAVLVAAAARHPEVTIIDWNAYSQDHYSWFQGDGVHLAYDGAIAMATLFHTALVESLLPPLVARPTRLPVALVGRPYSAQLAAQGGTTPYAWRLTSGPLPRGLRLLADGRLIGTPRRAATLELVFRVTDALGQTAVMQTSLVIRRDTGSPERTRATNSVPPRSASPLTAG